MTPRRSTITLTVTLSALLPLAALASGPEVDPGTTKRGGPPPKLAAAPRPSTVPASPAQRAVVDPRTGQLVKHPPASGVVLSPEMQEALSDSAEGLVEIPWRRGGVKVDLKGRFQSAVVATVDENGAVKTECVSHVSHPETAPEKPTEPNHAK